MSFKKFAADSICNNAIAVKRIAKQVEENHPEVDSPLLTGLETTADSFILAAILTFGPTQEKSKCA